MSLKEVISTITKMIPMALLPAQENKTGNYFLVEYKIMSKHNSKPTAANIATGMSRGETKKA